MGFKVVFRNSLGDVEMYGDSRGSIRIVGMEGLGPVENEYRTVVYNGLDGQETLSSRALPRSITMALEVCDGKLYDVAKRALRIFGKEGYLYIRNQFDAYRIFCNQVRCPEVTKVIKSNIASFVVQFVCDSPYFEDECETVIPLYKRIPLLETPFSLPGCFGDIVLGARIDIEGCGEVEPKIRLYYPEAMDHAGEIVLGNLTTGAQIRLLYMPSDRDTVTIDVKKRRVISSVNGNIINCLSDDVFLSDFVLKCGVNILTVEMDEMPVGTVAECCYTNLYGEAVNL